MPEGSPMATLVYRHNRITRLTHWVNAVALAVLFMSGLQIFNAFPRLHWGDKTDPEDAFLSITAKEDDGDLRGYTDVFGYRIDTTGLLGLEYTDAGPSARAFPSWITIPGFFWLAGGRRWHFFFGWLFALNGLLYFVFNLFNGHMRKFLFTPKNAAKVPAMVLYYLRLRRQSPQDEEYNPLQKLAYTSVFLILTPVVLLSGMAMSPQLNVAFNWLPAAFGGRQAARTVHFILAFGFILFTFGHVFMVLTTGVVNNMRSMLTGWYREKAPPRQAPSPIEPEVIARVEEERPSHDIPQAIAEPQASSEPAPAEKPISQPDATQKVAAADEGVAQEIEEAKKNG
jgi:Ni/Fe-hydrogenase b-type cytochrome subunit